MKPHRQHAREITARLVETYLGAQDLYRTEIGDRGAVFEEMRKLAEELRVPEPDCESRKIVHADGRVRFLYGNIVIPTGWALADAEEVPGA